MNLDNIFIGVVILDLFWIYHDLGSIINFSNFFWQYKSVLMGLFLLTLYLCWLFFTYLVKEREKNIRHDAESKSREDIECLELSLNSEKNAHNESKRILNDLKTQMENLKNQDDFYTKMLKIKVNKQHSQIQRLYTKIKKHETQ